MRTSRRYNDREAYQLDAEKGLLYIKQGHDFETVDLSEVTQITFKSQDYWLPDIYVLWFGYDPVFLNAEEPGADMVRDWAMGLDKFKTDRYQDFLTLAGHGPIIVWEAN